MKIAGIDAGVEGAVALLDTAADTLAVHDIELLSDRTIDAHWLLQLLLEFEPDLVVTEATFRVPKLVRMTWEITAVAKVLQLDCRVVAVVSWKTKMLGLNTNEKDVSIACARKLRPDAPLRRPRARTDSADRAEAILLAYYGATPTPAAATGYRRRPSPPPSGPSPPTSTRC